MSFRRKLKLRSFTISTVGSSGETEKKVLKRGYREESQVALSEKFQKTSGESEDDRESIGGGDSGGDMDTDEIFSSEQLPSLHSIKQKANVAAWLSARSSLLNVCTEMNSLCPNLQCSLCNSNKARFRCLQCGPCTYFCSSCLDFYHAKTSVLHSPEEFKNGVYCPAPCKRVIDPRPDHNCTHKKVTTICVIDGTGNQHSVELIHCTCEPLSVTMCRAQIWPSCPTSPRVGFSFEFLDWAEAMLYECQVALKDFCLAINYKSFNLHWKDIYGCLIDAFEEYRYMKHELRRLKFLVPEMEDENVCPACPKSDGIKVISLDALFGLPRRKLAGQSYRNSLHGNLFFSDQASVDAFVDSHKSLIRNDDSLDCSEFKAGHALRSSSRYHKLDETGIFGCACRHEFPLHFCNLKHGERLAYSIHMLEKLVANKNNNQLFVMYDIACTLEKHLKSIGRLDLQQKVKALVVPSFHAYGHSAKCQVLYSPLRIEGIGLSDGEVMERLWSYLRRFSRMTKEMRPAHREDVLSHAMLYYCQKKTERMGRLLGIRYQRAVCAFNIANENYNEFSSKHKFSSELVDTWIETEKADIMNKVTHKGTAGEIKKGLWSGVVRRQFLLQLKAKYSDGQKIEKRLSSKIAKEVNGIKFMLKSYLACTGVDVDYHSIINIDSSNKFWNDLYTDEDSDQERRSNVIPSTVKRQIIHNVLMMRRSGEEKLLLKQDMLNTINFMHSKTNMMEQAAKRIDRSDLTMAGGYSLLKQKMLRWKLLTMKAVATFVKLIDIPDEIVKVTERMTNENDCISHQILEFSESSDEEPSDDEELSDDDMAY